MFSTMKLLLSSRCLLAVAVSMGGSAYAQGATFSAIYSDTYDEVCGADDDADGCAEISALDAANSRLFTTNASENQLRVLDLDDMGRLVDVGIIDLSDYGDAPNSVAVSEGVVAVAVEAEEKTENGQIVFFDSQNLQLLAQVPAGALPDMVTFTPDGAFALVANEGEPSDDYQIDPVGSVTIINMLDYSTRTAGFESFTSIDDSSVRIFGPGASVAQDLEPEYITVSADSTTAWISLQENNALAILDIASATITAVKGLGFKNHAMSNAEFDASDKDGVETCAIALEDAEQCVNIQMWPTSGMYQPDAIVSYTVDGANYIVSANEGDARDYDGFSEEARVGDEEYILDPVAFPNAEALKDDALLGRLKTTLSTGDTDGDGDFDNIHSYGARSFSIWDSAGEQVFDSGADFEIRLAALQQSGADVWTDGRSDDKGPEPESVTVGILAGKPVGFIGLERTSGIFAYDLSIPQAPVYLGYIDIKTAGNVAPEGLVFKPVDENNGVLVVTSEVSNTISTYRVMLTNNDMPVAPGTSTLPQVRAGMIEWEGAGYWQVQTIDPYDSICEGSSITSCEVAPGVYNVINLSTGERFESIEVGGDATDAVQVSGSVISWTGAGYWQVQTIEPYESVCEGSDISSCDVAPGEYNVINLTTGRRFENVLIGSVGNDAPVNDGFALKILHINDHHSHLDAEGTTLTLAGEETSVEYGGFTRVVSKMRELEQQSDSALKLHAGDAITGTLFFTLFEGEADAALMNEVCFDAFALGNHEFDKGDAGLRDFLDDLAAGPCETDVLAANVVPELGVSPLAFTSATDYIKPFTIETINGEEMGIVGIDIAFKTQNSSNPDETTQFLDETTTAQRFIDELLAQGVDKIVLLTHYQYRNDMELARALRGVDVIVGGDSHTLLGEGFNAYGLYADGPYPTRLSNADGNQVCVAQAWQYSYVVGELDVQFDANGNVTACNGIPHLLLGDTFERDDENGDPVTLTGDALAAVTSAIESAPELSIVTPDANASAILQGYSSQTEQLAQAVIGSAAEDLCLERIPGQGRNQVCEVSETDGRGSDIANIVALAFKTQSNTSDIALQNGGGVRIDIPAGPVTVGDAYTLLPFANTLLEVDMTGEQIVNTLEDALDFALNPDGSTGAFPYASGLRWDIDASQEKGMRFSNVEVKLKNETVWSAIDSMRVYKVVTNDFIGAGRDGYFTLGDIPDDLKVDTFLDYAQSFVDYVTDIGTLTRLPIEDYSTQSYMNTDGVLQ